MSGGDDDNDEIVETSNAELMNLYTKLIDAIDAIDAKIIENVKYKSHLPLGEFMVNKLISKILAKFAIIILFYNYRAT